MRSWGNNEKEKRSNLFDFVDGCSNEYHWSTSLISAPRQLPTDKYKVEGLCDGRTLQQSLLGDCIQIYIQHCNSVIIEWLVCKRTNIYIHTYTYIYVFLVSNGLVPFVLTFSNYTCVVVWHII